MKNKVITLTTASVTVQDIGELTKISVADGYFNPIKWEFYVPSSTKDKFGFIPSSIVKSRMLHDFNVKIGYYSVTHIPSKKQRN